jgi:hypothetical protein
VELVGRFRDEISAPAREARDAVVALRGALGEVSELLTKLSASGGNSLTLLRDIGSEEIPALIQQNQGERHAGVPRLSLRWRQ